MMKSSAVKAANTPCGGGEETCVKCLGRHPAVKGALSLAERDAIHDFRRQRVIARGERLFGGARIVIAHLAKGVIKLTPPGDQTQIAGILFAPEIVGAEDFRNFHAYALSKCELCCFDAAAVKAIFASHPHLAESFWQHSLDSLGWMRRDASLLNAADATHRVAALFWVIACREREMRAESNTPAANASRDAIEITLPITLAGAATLLGLAPETISRRIGVLQRAGLVRKTGTRRYLVPDVGRLRGVVGEVG